MLDEEPYWQKQLWENINYYKKGLIDIGTTNYAIIPLKIGNVQKISEVGKILLENGIYTNPIMYPAVSLKDSRIIMNIMAIHTKEQLDKTLIFFDYINKKLDTAIAISSL